MKKIAVDCSRSTFNAICFMSFLCACARNISNSWVSLSCDLSLSKTAAATVFQNEAVNHLLIKNARNGSKKILFIANDLCWSWLQYYYGNGDC